MSSAKKTYHFKIYRAKRQRQQRFFARVAVLGLSVEKAADEARLIPKEIVREFQVLRWAR